jgi:small redox-active disulfide protein 2
MKQVKVLGTGCANCRTTVRLIEEVAQEHGVAVEVEKVERIEDIVASGVMRTPGVIVDGKVVHAGGVPKRDAVAGWLQAA